MDDPSKNSLLDSINPEMKLDKAFFLRVYGYEISYPGFSDQAIQILEAEGCSKAREHYGRIVSQHQQVQDEIMRPVAEWYMGECARKWNLDTKAGERQRKQEVEQLLKRKRALLILKSQQLTQS